MRKKVIILLGVALYFFSASAQQVPYYSQLNSSQYLYNPATTGARKVFEAGLCYRTQWVDFEGHPKTQAVFAHGSLWKGRMGLGGYAYKDETGPSRRNIYGGSYAFHIKFPDMKMSLGISWHFMRYMLDGSKITLHNSQDKAIDRSIEDVGKSSNGNAGFYLHNDRFHFGLSVLNLAQKNVELYKEDSLKKGIIRQEPHQFMSVGYNASHGLDFIWENNLLASYVTGAPITLEYALKLHYKQTFFGGVGIRMRDAIIFHLGANLQDFRFSYSYDYITSSIKTSASGSHEITLAFRTNFNLDNRKGYRFEEFLRQKYKL